jgi:Cysteine/serine-rich nuclear protein N-terminus
MGPPPPPSASYLWKFDDTDTEEEEQDDDVDEEYSSGIMDMDDIRRDVHETNDTMSRYLERNQTSSTPYDRVESVGSHKTTTSATLIGTTTTSTSTLPPPTITSSYVVDPMDGTTKGGGTCSNEGTIVTTKKRSGKKNKKNRNKKLLSSSPTSITGTSATNAPDTVPVVTQSDRHNQCHHVTFDSVTTYTFRRCFGLCVVPTRGGWPLGMEYHNDDDTMDAPSASTEIDTRIKNNTTTTCSKESNQKDSPKVYFSCLSIDDYEQEKQQRLLKRFQTAEISGLPKQTENVKKEKKAINITTNNARPSYYETRQWDYKNGKNPLFVIVHESDRMKLLLDATPSLPNDTTVEMNNDNMPNKSSSARSKATRSRSSSSHNQASSTGNLNGTNGGSGGEQFNHIYTSTYVHSVRNELEQIRNNRTTGIGCTCRQLQVPMAVPSTLSTSPTSQKKSHHNHNHKRMKLQKLKDELIKRNLLSSSSDATHDTSTEMTREEMEQLLHDTVGTEPCCLYPDACFCARNGIGCQADVCTCWHSSHSSIGSNSTKSNKASSSSSAITAQEIQQRCGNSVGGMYVVDDHKIDTFRNDYLHRLKVCPFIKLEE